MYYENIVYQLNWISILKVALMLFTCILPIILSVSQKGKLYAETNNELFTTTKKTKWNLTLTLFMAPYEIKRWWLRIFFLILLWNGKCCNNPNKLYRCNCALYSNNFLSFYRKKNNVNFYLNFNFLNFTKCRS